MFRAIFSFQEDIRMAETFICSECRREYPIENCTTFEDRNYCPDCFRELTCVCDRCGQRVLVEDSESDGHITLCEHCYNHHYDTCADCGRILERDRLHYLDDDECEGYCDNCYPRHHQEGPGVESYYYKPEPVFYGSGPRFLGVELEIDGAGESNDNANCLMQLTNRDCDHIYIKHDGSLNDGLEIVTHPMSLHYHQTEMPWQAIVDLALSMGYTSHKAHTCGLHVHVNRSSLGENYRQQEDSIARILFFVENHWNELLKFSRRTPRQMENWAARYGRKDEPKEVLDSAKNSRKGRYTCVNLTNSDTIEFRMFRGTLKYNTIIATLQFVERVCDVAVAVPDALIKGMTWTDLFQGFRMIRCLSWSNT